MMKAFAYPKYGDASVAQVMSVPVPEVASPTTLRVKVHASSFNPIDFKRRSGLLKSFSPEKVWPVILGYDAAGVVDKVGSGVKKFKEGDQIYVRVGYAYPAQGTCAEYTLATEDMVAPKPKNMSFEEAASCPLAAITAMQMLRKAGLKKGDTVFINAGAGGVGHFAIQIAKALGAAKVVSTASSAKHAFLKQLGCDEVIDYKTQDYTQVYSDRPFDIAIDNVSECIPLCKVVKPGGWIVSNSQGFSGASFTEGGRPAPNWIVKAVLYWMRWSLESAAAAAQVKFHCLFLRPNSEDLEKLTALVEAGQVKATVNVFEGIDKAAEAMAMLEGGRTTGKVVVKIV